MSSFLGTKSSYLVSLQQRLKGSFCMGWVCRVDRASVSTVSSCQQLELSGWSACSVSCWTQCRVQHWYCRGALIRTHRGTAQSASLPPRYTPDSLHWSEDFLHKVNKLKLIWYVNEIYYKLQENCTWTLYRRTVTHIYCMIRGVTIWSNVSLF